jgi:23S rRNA pseudouridine2605 synthase
MTDICNGIKKTHRMESRNPRKRAPFKKDSPYSKKKSSGSFYKKDDKSDSPKRRYNADKKDERPSYRDFAKDKPEKKFFKEDKDEKKSYGKPYASKHTFGNRPDSKEDRPPFNKYSKDKPERKSYGKDDDSRKKSYNRAKPYEKKNYGKRDDDRKNFDDKAQSKTHKPYKKFSDDKPGKKPYLTRSDKRRIAGISFPEERMKSEADERAERIEKAETEGIRLNKFLANAGISARRKADEFIKQGMVTVNGVVVTEMGHKVTRKDKVLFNGKPVIAGKKVYILLNKPKDAISTTDDDRDRRTVMDLIGRATDERVYPVGRLDRNTTGLLLFTNDGELAEKLSHPRYEVKKVYAVELDKGLTAEDMKKIKDGIQMEEGLAKVDDIQYVDTSNKKLLGIEIHTGWNRIVRRIFEALGYEVKKLDRMMYAGLTKKDLPRGKWRFLNEKEVVMLKHFI